MYSAAANTAHLCLIKAIKTFLRDVYFLKYNYSLSLKMFVIIQYCIISGSRSKRPVRHQNDYLVDLRHH